MATEPLPQWHPADEFIEPVAKALAPIATGPYPSHEQVRALLELIQSDSFLIGCNWLEFNVTPHYAQAFSNRIEALVDDLSAGAAKPKHGLTIEVWEHVRVRVQNELLFLVQLANILRQRVRFDKLDQSPQFVPSALQRRILAKLSGRARTADQLEGDLNVSRSTLFGGKDKRGGIGELVELGLAANDRKIGGYYRPDPPPPKEG